MGTQEELDAGFDPVSGTYATESDADAALEEWLNPITAPADSNQGCGYWEYVNADAVIRATGALEVFEPEPAHSDRLPMPDAVPAYNRGLELVEEPAFSFPSEPWPAWSPFPSGAPDGFD